MSIKVAVVSGRPADGTLLPKVEKYVWQELKRVLTEDMAIFKEKQVEFLIPIYNKFDLEVLRICEHYDIKVTYYLPNPEWGTEVLPKHQIDLIRRMRKNVWIVPGSYTDRINRMIRDSDMVYVLPQTKGVEQFAEELSSKPFYLFPVNKMRYTTEEEAHAFLAQSIQSKKPSQSDIDAIMSRVSLEDILT